MFHLGRIVVVFCVPNTFNASFDKLASKVGVQNLKTFGVAKHMVFLFNIKLHILELEFCSVRLFMWELFDLAIRSSMDYFEILALTNLRFLFAREVEQPCAPFFLV